MTSINAIRFDDRRGAVVVDETISMGGNLTFHGSDKVRNCVPEPVRQAFGTVAGLAGTGSCSFTDTIKREFHDWLLAQWRAECEKAGGRPARFHSLDRMAEGLFDLVVAEKNRRMSERLRGEFGFTVPEFVAGQLASGEKIEDAALTQKVTQWLSWRNQEREVAGIFLNALLLAGYDEDCGFAMYHVDLRDGYWHRIQTCYMAEGSGRFSVDPTMYPFVERLRVDERRGEVDPVEGLVAMLAALTSASEHETGVGGYPTVMLIDGTRPLPERQREIADDRAWLASRAVKAHTHGYLGRGPCYALVEGLLFGDLGADQGWEDLKVAARNWPQVSRLLRGYKVAPA